MPSNTRDDRTYRAVSELVGVDSAELALSHFSTKSVSLSVSGTLLNSKNGWAAIELAMNMLSRFVGRVSLRIMGPAEADVSRRVSHMLNSVREIDHRTTVTLEHHTSHDLADFALIAEGAKASDSPQHVVIIGFDAWNAKVAIPPTRLECLGSEIPFGALCAVCFGAAEIFKALLAQATLGLTTAFPKERLVERFDFNAWVGDRGQVEESGPYILREVDVSTVTVVGAGAVANGVVFALTRTAGITGTLDVIDAKLVDEKNLNRCLFFKERHVGKPKVEVLEEESVDGLRVLGHRSEFDPGKAGDTPVLVSTVDNNAARHLMQETVPALLIQGSTGSTTACVSSHTAVDEHACLVCMHRDRIGGTARRAPLALDDTARLTGLAAEAVTTGMVAGSTAITDEIIDRALAEDPRVGAFLKERQVLGEDLCGAIGNFRESWGTDMIPAEASVPFVSAFAGIVAAARTVRYLTGSNRNSTGGVLRIDLARDYARHESLSAPQPASADCPFCVSRRDAVRQLYQKRWGMAAI